MESFYSFEQEIRSQPDYEFMTNWHVSDNVERDQISFTFIDGPPFATGKPHYGHILAGCMKDTIVRYHRQKGELVDAKFCWDCHGLPVEFAMEKEHGIKTRLEAREMGLFKYNEQCAAIVCKHEPDWRQMIKQTGRSINMDNAYRSMDPYYMNTVWAIFFKLFKNGSVYLGHKVMPYSLGCATPLSNFEAKLNYKNVKATAFYVQFKIENENDTYFLVWTTTPWTLPFNRAMVVNPTDVYVKIHDHDRDLYYVLMKDRLKQIYKKKKNTIIEEFTSEFLTKFTYMDMNGESRPVFSDSYVKNTSGTGVVHMAPMFGEDDYRIAKQHGLTIESSDLYIDASGNFTDLVPELTGQHLTTVTRVIRKMLDQNLFKEEVITHSYPYCWRSETPIVYRTVSSWFVSVEPHAQELVDNNAQMNWYPKHVGTSRMASWLANAQDWCISRNRYWGCPIPLWINEDGTEVKCISSSEELESLTGITINDLHRQHIDDLIIEGKTGKLHRIDAVFDCWFESAALPFVQREFLTYGLKDKSRYQVDFVAEGLDQTRGWFYTCLVLSTLLCQCPPYRNVMVNGLVLAEDGVKMSKSKDNYPDPQKIITTYGADPLRFYLLRSPLLSASPVKFKQAELYDIVKTFFIKWYNTQRYTLQKIEFLETSGCQFVPDLSTIDESIDKWMLARMDDLICRIEWAMDHYDPRTAMTEGQLFLDDISNWYIHLNRERLNGRKGLSTQIISLSVLYHTLYKWSIVMASLSPLISDYMYNQLTKFNLKPSVHQELFPIISEYNNIYLVQEFKRFQKLVELGRSARKQTGVSFKYALEKIILITDFDMDCYEEYFKTELNVHKAELASDQMDKYLSAKIHLKGHIGKRLKNKFIPIRDRVLEQSDQIYRLLKETSGFTFEDYRFESDEYEIYPYFTGNKNQYSASWSDDDLVIITRELTKENEQKGWCREFSSWVQKTRKEIGLIPTDQIIIYISGDGKVYDVLVQNEEFLTWALHSTVTYDTYENDSLIKKDFELNSEIITVVIVRN